MRTSACSDRCGTFFKRSTLQTRLFDILESLAELFADETRCPVLDRGRKRVKLGQLWAYARDDRPWGGGDPPGVVYCYAPGRGSET